MENYFLQSNFSGSVQSSLNESFSNIIEQLTPEFPHTSFVTDLAIIMILASIVTLAFFKIKQPLIIGYLFAGMLNPTSCSAAGPSWRMTLPRPGEVP